MEHYRAWMSFLIGLIIALFLFTGATIAIADGQLSNSSGICGDNLTWVLDSSGTLTISGTGEFTEFYASYATPWYSQNESIKKIIINDGVTDIGPFAFFGCTNVESVSIPDSVTELGGLCFSFCESLSEIILPEKIKTIGYRAFQYCTKLEQMIIPDSVVYIGEYAFVECRSLISVSLSSSITELSYCIFSRCTSLNKFVIPKGVKKICDSAFTSCEHLSSLTFSESVTDIGQSAFHGCSNLKEIHISNIKSWVSINYPVDNSWDSHPTTQHEWKLYIGDTEVNRLVIPEGVTSICDYAFNYCTSLTDVVLPESLTSIGDYAFNECYGIEHVTIPSNVVKIGSGAFYIRDPVISIAFAVTDDTREIDFGYNWFYDATIYCHKFTSPHSWCVNNSITPIFFEDVDIGDILQINLEKDITIACGETRAIAYGIFPLLLDKPDIEWSTSDPTILTVSGGVITAYAPGTVTVTASLGSVSASVNVQCILTVTDFELSADELWVLAMDDVQLSIASIMPEGAKGTFTWSSSNTNLALTDQNGSVTTIKPGDVTITVLSDSGVSKNCVLHLCYPVTNINLISSERTVMAGEELQLTAQVTMNTQYCENHLVTFTSSDDLIATVDSKTGLVHGIKPGTVVITALSQNNKSAALTIRVQFNIIGLDILQLPLGLDEVKEEAFAGAACQAVIIPHGCRSIGKRAFADCKHLLYVFIPSTVTTIASDAFDSDADIVFEYENSGS